MTNASKDKGTRWETAVVRWLRANGQGSAERLALHGVRDQGDVGAFEVGGLQAVGECKWLADRPGPALLAEWCRQTRAERDERGAKVGVLFVHEPGCGESRMGRNSAHMTARDTLRVLWSVARAASCGDELDDAWVRVDLDTLGRWL